MGPPLPFSGSSGQKGSLEYEPTFSPDISDMATAETAEEERTRERTGIVAESMRGRKGVGVDVSLDTLRSRTHDPETPRIITDINFDESAEQQRERLERLELVSAFVIAGILHADQRMDAETLKQFDAAADLRRLFTATQKSGGRYESENAAITKLEQMLNHADSDAAANFMPKWGAIVARAAAIEQNMRALQNANLRAPAEKREHKEKGMWNSAVELFRKHPILSSIGLIAGAYGAYKLISAAAEKISGAKTAVTGGAKGKSGFFGWIAGAAIAVLGLFGLGRFLGVDGVKKFIKEKFGWDVDANRATKALQLASKGKFKEGLALLWEGVDENQKFHDNMAQYIAKSEKNEVSGKTLFEIRDENFEDFISTSAQMQDEAGLRASDVPFVGSALEGLSALDSKQKNREQITVRAFLRRHEKLVRGIMAIRPDTTVEECLAKLAKHLGAGYPELLASAGAAAAGSAKENSGNSPASRDQSIDRMKNADSVARAVETEKILAQKISNQEIQEARAQILEREQSLRSLLAKPLSPAEREDTEERLNELIGQRTVFEELTKNHASAEHNYAEALNAEADAEALKERAAELIAAKEKIEEQIGDIFDYSVWTYFLSLAASHSVRIGQFTYRRYIKFESIKNEHANYLFGKFIKRLKPENLKESLKRTAAKVRGKSRTRKLPSIAGLARNRGRMHKAMQEFVDELHTTSGSTHTAETLTREHFDRLNALEKSITAQQDHIDGLIADRTKKLTLALGAGKKADAQLLAKELHGITLERSALEYGTTKQLDSAFQRWSRAIKGVGGKPAVKTKGISAFRGFVQRVIMKERHSLKSTRIIFTKGRMVFTAAKFLIPGIIGGELIKDDKTSRSAAWAQGIGGAAPVLGTYLDFYSAIKGKEKYTGHALDSKERAIAAMFGVTGLLTDALFVFGIGMAGRAGLATIKTGRSMAKTARIIKAFDAAKDAKTAARGAKWYQAAESGKKIAFRVSIGTALGSAAYMAFSEQASYAPSHEFQNEVLADISTPEAPEAPPETGGIADAAA